MNGVNRWLPFRAIRPEVVLVVAIIAAIAAIVKEAVLQCVRVVVGSWY